MLLSALGSGLWIIPLGLILGSIWSFYRSFKQWKSGSAGYEKDARGVDVWVENDEKVPYFSIGATWFGIILLCAAIGSFIWMHLEK
jgi:dolichol kinase